MVDDQQQQVFGIASGVEPDRLDEPPCSGPQPGAGGACLRRDASGPLVLGYLR
jgi:hypothetical protein